ncbi:homeobox-leucine zipper protein HAT14-like [Lycium ferocissimum]|uniref:homeobox-leucine zipper protein HAT14-like n=1 Tax=Lycium ferocissimum TaxID=112874 RepID=UPI002816438F|nr:homeobox-leucine zipper protein HAT14-like [Lycium ferocissimum]
MANNDNEACDTRLTLGLATSDHHSLPKQNQQEHNKIVCLDLSIVPLHSSDNGTSKIDGSSSKTSENYNNFKNVIKKNGMRKKLRLTKEQSTLLEDSFKRHATLAMGQKQELAAKLKLKPRQVEVWFQNRRARTKLKQTEVDCEFLKKWCQSLNDENNRLKKELQELRSIKIDQRTTPFHLQLPKTRTLALCSSCQKISRSETDEKHETGPKSG